MTHYLRPAVVAILLLAGTFAVARAEVIEQILVKVNGEIFTKSDLEARQVAALRQQLGQQVDLKSDPSDARWKTSTALFSARLVSVYTTPPALPADATVEPMPRNVRATPPPRTAANRRLMRELFIPIPPIVLGFARTGGPRVPSTSFRQGRDRRYRDVPYALLAARRGAACHRSAPCRRRVSVITP